MLTAGGFGGGKGMVEVQKRFRELANAKGRQFGRATDDTKGGRSHVNPHRPSGGAAHRAMGDMGTM